MIEYKRGDYRWTDETRKEVKFVENTDGRFTISIWKPNVLQRFFYWVGLLKDPRFNGKYKNRFFNDEVGQFGIDPFENDK